MRKKLFVLLSSLALALSLLAVTTTPANAAACSLVWDSKGKYVGDGDGDTSDDAYVKAWVWYNYCERQNPTKRWVKVQWVRVQVNWPAHTLDCANGKYRDGAWWNWYFWDPDTGRNFNPGPFKVKCDEAGINGRTVTYTEHPDNIRLYLHPTSGHIGRPRWKFNVRITKRWNPDASTSYGQIFKPWT